MNCGAKLQEGAKFCMNCGMAIGENKSNETKLVPAKCTISDISSVILIHHHLYYILEQLFKFLFRQWF